MKKKSSGKKETKQEAPGNPADLDENLEALSKQSQSTPKDQESPSLDISESKQEPLTPFHDENVTKASPSTKDHQSFETPSIRGVLDQLPSQGESKYNVNEQVIPFSQNQPMAVSQESRIDCEENHNQFTTGDSTRDYGTTLKEAEGSTSDQGIIIMQLPKEELQRKVLALQEKVDTLNKHTIEYEAQIQAEKLQREIAEKECNDLRTRLAQVEMDNLQLVVEKERANQTHENIETTKGISEERKRLEKRVRDLEAEIYKLRGDAWKERRKSAARLKSISITSPGAKFTEVDLGCELSPRRQNAQTDKGGLGGFISSSFNALTGTDNGMDSEGDFLEDSGLIDFDEDAFRRAREEEAKERIERIKDVKRSLKKWEGWKLDLAESRRVNSGGVGIVFEV